MKPARWVGKIFVGRITSTGVHLSQGGKHTGKSSLEASLAISNKELHNGSYPSDGKMLTGRAALLNGGEIRTLCRAHCHGNRPLSLAPEKGSPRTDFRGGQSPVSSALPPLAWTGPFICKCSICLLWPLNLANSDSVPGGYKGASTIGKLNSTLLITCFRDSETLPSPPVFLSSKAIDATFVPGS